MKATILTTSLIFAGTLMLSACTTPAPQINEAEIETEVNAAFLKKYENKMIIHYQCEPDKRDIEMRYFPDHGVAVLVLEGVTHELQQQVSGSGFWYSNGKYTVRGKGDSLWLEIGRMMPIDCQAKAQ